MSVETNPKMRRLQMVIPPSLIVRVDTWRREQADLPSRSEAIRRLIEAGLKAESEQQNA